MAGQIIPRGERTFLVKVFLGRDENGKRQYHTKTIHGPKKDAEKYLNKVLRERDLGIHRESSQQPLNRYLDDWLATAAKPRLREQTFWSYVGVLDRYVRPAIGKLPLAKITPLHIQKLYTRMQDASVGKRALTPRTVRYTHAILRSALQQAVKWGFLPQNPADAVELPRRKQREMRALSADETRRFLAEVADDEHYGTMFLLAVTTGLRPSEYLGLRWGDINWKKGTLAVRRTVVHKKGGGWQFEDTKRARSRRTVKLQRTLLRALQEHGDRQAFQRKKTGEEWQEHDLVFSTAKGTPFEERNVVRYFKRAIQAAGLPDIRLYDLRHTAATLALAAGVQPKVVSEQMGHASTGFTQDVYSHVLPTMQEDAVARVEALLFGTQSTHHESGTL